MISRECQTVLDAIRCWAEKIRAAGAVSDLIRSRENFKLVSRPSASLEGKLFLANGVLSEWVCAAEADPAARLLLLHGGGFVAGDLDTTVPFAELLSQATGCAVLAVDYRLAPEHPYPEPRDDAVNAYRWLLRHGPRGPGRAGSVFLFGDSAGGSLALSTLLKLRDEGERLPECVLTLSAITDLSLSGESVLTRAALDPVLDLETLRTCTEAYLAGADPRDPYVSPLFADLHGLPPLFMQVGGREILLDDTLRFARKAEAAGVEVMVNVWPEMFHAWQMYAPLVPEAGQAMDRLAACVRGHLRSRKPRGETRGCGTGNPGARVPACPESHRGPGIPPPEPAATEPAVPPAGRRCGCTPAGIAASHGRRS